MTDITELAQRMKAAAVRAKAATEDYVAHRMSITVCLEECKEFNDLSDGPDNILALVEALEKAQQRITQLESRTVKLPESFKLAKSSSGLTYYYADEVDAALAAAGIKVEAE
ncbi:hypothetical protein [Klebsiella michiganensis]|uniref:hypothetical protein n=1 Tax=Klebsiella michiganensis TaxID=1134687 RepID=UPI002FE554A9